MNLLMVSGDRSVLQGKRGAFFQTLEEFSKHWNRVDILCPKSPSRNQQSGTSQSFPNVFFHPSPLGRWYQPFWICRKGRELYHMHRHKVMTVHEYPPFYNGTGARLLARATGIPFALEIHHIVGWPMPASVSEALGLRLSRWVLPREAQKATAIRVVNRDVRAVLCSWGVDPVKISVVPSFYLDRSVLVRDPTIRLTTDLVFCGRLVANKGLLELLEACSGLPSATLLVIGDGPLRNTAEACVRAHGLERRVRFIGWLPTQRDVARAMQAARLFVMNSRSEGGPRVALEAMALGMPVLTTRVGVMPEVIEDGMNGVFTTGHPADLRDKIKNLLRNDALRDHLGQEAQKITHRFERGKLIRDYVDFLQELV